MTDHNIIKRFDTFCKENYITVCRGNLYQVKDVYDYQSLIELLAEHPKAPNTNIEKIHEVIESMMTDTNSLTKNKIMYTPFQYTYFGINHPNIGGQIIREFKNRKQEELNNQQEE